MRLTSLALLGAVIAGCSSASTQGPQALPLGTSFRPQMGERAAQLRVPERLQCLKLQADGKLPTPLTREMLRKELRYLQSHPRPHLAFHHNAKGIGLWTSNGYGYVLGKNTAGTRTLTAIDVESNGCSGPQALKVDHAQNLWVACENGYGYSTGNIQEYANGNLTSDYVEGCPAASGCSDWQSYGSDSAADAHGHVFATLTQYSYYSQSQYIRGTGFEWWSSASSPPTLIPVPRDPVSNVSYMDVDAAGNLWFDYNGCLSNSCGEGLVEIKNPTSRSPQFVGVLAPGTLGNPQGIYVSNGGNTLNIIDESERTVAQYALPVTPSSTPLNVLGPTYASKISGCSEPISGGFNQLETKLALADGCSWTDIGIVAKNRWTAASTPEDASGEYGAAYTPSDK